MSIDIKEFAEEILQGSVDQMRARLKDKEALSLVAQHSLLSAAAAAGRLDMVEVLLDAGCDPNAKVKYGSRALKGALLDNRVEIARVLLEHGADPKADRYVVSAVVGGKPNALEMVKVLEEFGADIHQVYPVGDTDKVLNALVMAQTWNQPEVVAYLLSKGAVPPSAGAPVPAAPSLTDEIIAYFAANQGPVQPQHLTEIVPTTNPAIVVHIIPATQERNYTTLFTTGMSSKPMVISQGEDSAFRFGELFIELQGEWPLQTADLANPDTGWPIDCLRSMASYPHRARTCIGPVGITSNGNPPQPVSPGWPFTAMLLLAETHFISRDGRKIQLYRLMPLYSEEFDLHARDGISALMRAFDSNNIPFVVSSNRVNVAIGC